MRKLSKQESGRLGGIKTSQINKAIFNERVRLYEASPKRCKYCELAFPYCRRRNTFCSRSCSAKFNNPLNVSDKRKNNCKCCGSLITGAIYCDSKCQQEHVYQSRVALWIKTGNTESISGNCPKWVKRYILNKQSYCCARCGLKDWLGQPIVLELEHKDGNGSNNIESNLECLCPNCHSQTPTYKGKNVGNGRYSRRKRYLDGKSF